MARLEIILPKMGESVAEATITSWLKQVGDKVEADEAVLEIATDKVDSEVPAPEDGTITEVLFNEGDVVKVGEVIAVMDTEAESSSTPSAPSTSSGATASSAPTPRPEVVAQVEQRVEQSAEQVSSNGSNGRFYSPLVRSIARTEGITLQELESLPGSGRDGRVTKKDILAYIPKRQEGSATQRMASPEPRPEPVQQKSKPAPAPRPAMAPAVSVGGQDEIIEMDRMRKLIADHMVMSKQVSPHVTSYVEADVTNIVEWREKNKKSFLEREGEKLTFTPIFIEAVARAIKDFPMVNVSVDGDKIIRRGRINIGMATALPSGNLIVPVIKEADTLNMVGLARKVNDLAARARENQLLPDEIQGGTYTVTNVGTFGNVMGTPIINQPQSAILALGAIRKKPAVIETPEGDFIGIRHMMFLSHAYDHRVIDGALGGSFVKRVADYLEQFDPERTV
ncbi:MAG: 2-oxo acid dehydrogenase subunit E2 [Flavobacteriales bacterium]|nr:2-oxo acid dehydrogenase subunit E2 [Flavobacteriales bacterium]